MLEECTQNQKGVSVENFIPVKLSEDGYCYGCVCINSFF